MSYWVNYRETYNKNNVRFRAGVLLICEMGVNLSPKPISVASVGFNLQSSKFSSVKLRNK